MRTVRVFVRVFALTVLAFTLIGCNRAEKDWTEAKQANTIPAYEKFLANHPQGVHVEEAKNSIDALDWKDAEVKGTIDAYEGYLRVHPGGIHAVEVLDWDKTIAKGAPAPSEYSDFHRKYPDSKRVTAVMADIHCEQKLGITIGDATEPSFSSYLQALVVNVSGHPELSGEYTPEEAGARSLIEIYRKKGGVISDLSNAQLLVADIKGKPRVVAVDTR